MVCQQVTLTNLRPKVCIDLIDVPAAQRLGPVPATCHDGCELGVHHDSPACWWMVEHDVSSHRRENFLYARRLRRNLPSKCAAALDLPSLRREHDLIESTDRTLKEASHPSLLPVGQRHDIPSHHFGWQSQVKCQSGRRHHQSVIRIIAAEPVDAHLRAGRCIA